MKKIIIGILLFAFNFQTSAQAIYANYNDFETLKARPLVVVSLEIDQKKINKLEEKMAKTKDAEHIKKIAQQIEDEKNLVKTYNKNIKLLTQKYMNYHPEIIYMTGDEYNKIEKEAKNQNKYTVLKYSDSSKEYEDLGVYQSDDISIPTLNYSRIEKIDTNPDYRFYIPYFGKYYQTLSKTNLDLAFRLMLRHIDYIVKNGKDKLYFTKYARIQMFENCKDLAGSDIYIAEKNIGKHTALSKINKKYKKGNVNLVSPEEIEKILENQEYKVIGIAIPYRVAGKISAKIMFARILLNASDLTIYAIKGVRMGEYYDGKFRAKEFKEYGRCK